MQNLNAHLQDFYSSQYYLKFSKDVEKIKTLGFVYKKDQIINDFHNKNIQILFYKGQYLEMKENLDLLIDNTKLENKYLNDLIEIKNILLFFNQDEESFKKYSSIQHKIKMNKYFEATFELIQLINSENILIRTQFIKNYQDNYPTD